MRRSWRFSIFVPLECAVGLTLHSVTIKLSKVLSRRNLYISKCSSSRQLRNFNSGEVVLFEQFSFLNVRFRYRCNVNACFLVMQLEVGHSKEKMASVLRNLRFASAFAKFEFQASSPAGTLSLQPAGVWNTGSPSAAIAAKQRSDDTAAVFSAIFAYCIIWLTALFFLHLLHEHLQFSRKS
jgi:hypothetical protein